MIKITGSHRGAMKQGSYFDINAKTNATSKDVSPSTATSELISDPVLESYWKNILNKNEFNVEEATMPKPVKEQAQKQIEEQTKEVMFTEDIGREPQCCDAFPVVEPDTRPSATRRYCTEPTTHPTFPDEDPTTTYRATTPTSWDPGCDDLPPVDSDF